MTPGGVVSLLVDDLACQRGERMLFEHVSFQAAAASLTAIRGANGSGKTSLLRLLAGFGVPAAGRIVWQALPVGAIAWLGHNDGLKADLSPRENLEFYRRYHGAEGDVERALANAGLTRQADLPTRMLSAGQRRRTALARLALVKAAVWVLDEPLTALDDDGQAWVSAIIDKHCGAGGMAVVTSHQRLVGVQPQQELVL